MDARLRDLIRKFRAEPAAETAMRIAAIVSKTDDGPANWLAVGAVEDSGSGLFLFSREIGWNDISEDKKVCHQNFQPQMVANFLEEESGTMPDQILIIGYDDTSPGVIYHWNHGRDYWFPRITAMLNILEALGLGSDTDTDNEGQIIIYTGVKRRARKNQTKLEKFDRVFGVDIQQDYGGQAIIYTGIYEDGGEEAEDGIEENDQ